MSVTPMAGADLPAIITVAQAAELLGVTRRTFYSLAARGAIPPDVVVRSGRALWVLRGRLEEWAGIRNGVGPTECDGEAPRA